MKRKLLLLLILCFVVICSVIAFTACSNSDTTDNEQKTEQGDEQNKEPIHSHTYGEWEITAPTKQTTGKAVKVCSANDTHRLEVTLPILTDETYTCSLTKPATTISKGEMTYIFKHSEGDIIFIVYTPQKSVEMVQLEQLIEDIKKSNLNDDLSNATVSVLNELLNNFDDFEDENVMKNSVITAVKVIDSIFEAENSVTTFYSELSKFEKTEQIASSLLKSVMSYKSSVKITTLAEVNSLAENGDAVISECLTVGIKEEREILCGKKDEETVTIGLRDRALKAEISEFLNSYNAALEASGYAETDDALFAALNTLSVKLEGYGENAVNGGYSPATLWDYIGRAMDEFVNSGTVALSVQMYNCMIDEFVREKLAEIFGLSSSDLPAQDTVVPVNVY